MGNKEFIQKDLVVLFLRQMGGTAHAYDLKKAPFVSYNNKTYHLGSEGDRRAMELFEKDSDYAEREVDGLPYKIVREGTAKDRIYRLVGEMPRKKQYRKIGDTPDGLAIMDWVVI